MFYTGVGSRETPRDVQAEMTKIAKRLDRLGYILRSGGAPGADSAFSIGARKFEVYLPWNGFNGLAENRGKGYIVVKENTDSYIMAQSIMENHHPSPQRLFGGARKLMIRNTFQVLGEDLKTPSNFLICWTKNGKDSGGTGQAIRIAKKYGITIYNLQKESDRDNLNSALDIEENF